MARKAGSGKYKPLIAMTLLSGMLLCACDTAVTDTSSLSSETTVITETTTETSATSATTTATETSETTESSTTATIEETTEVPTSVVLIEDDRDIGYGPYGFLIGDLRFHSQNDISMMLQQEDATVYDFGAKKCDWIDAFYVNDSFDMRTLDASERFLTFYNYDTSVSFSGYVSIGDWTTPKGSNLELYLAEITIISDNLVIRILPKYSSNPDYYDVSINGRGYYVSKDQLQMMDFILSSLAEEPGVDPLEGIFSSIDHTYYF